MDANINNCYDCICNHSMDTRELLMVKHNIFQKITWWIKTIMLYFFFDINKAKMRLMERRKCKESCKIK